MAVTTAVSAYGQAQQQKQTYDYQSKIAANNAKVAEWQAEDAVQRGTAAEAQQRRINAQKMGGQRAALASSGVDISDGSALSILEDTQYFGELDVNTVHDNAAREAWGYKVQGSNAQASANMYGSAAGNTNPLMSGAMAGVSAYSSGGGKFGGTKGGSLMGSGGQVSSIWYGGVSNRG